MLLVRELVAALLGMPLRGELQEYICTQAVREG